MEDIKTLSKEELERRIDEKKKSIIDFRVQLVSQQLKDYKQIPKIKKEIARLSTALTAIKKESKG